MSREIDKRDHSRMRATPVRERTLRSTASTISDRLPGSHRIRISRFNSITGNPAAIASENAPAETGNYVQRALDHVRSISRALGLTATQPAEFVADPDYQKTSSGSVAVHIEQQHRKIPIFNAAQIVHFAPDGKIKKTVGSSLTISGNIAHVPRLPVQEAVLKAAAHVAVPGAKEYGAKDEFGQPLQKTQIDLGGFEPTVIAAFSEKPGRPTVLDPGPFDSIKASLLWFPLNDELRLTWQVIIELPNFEGQYRTLVDAETGDILYCHDQRQFVSARGNVYRVDGAGPRHMTDFPRLLTDYGLTIPEDLPDQFPDDWVTEDGTVGNAVIARLGVFGPPSQGESQAGVVTFDPSDPDGDDQKVLNIFYYNCFMHDYFYLLGFREADGNFQRNNFGRGGLDSDRVVARAHSGVVDGTANMGTPPDGSDPIMNMGLVASTNRHTAFDSSVVYHEFTHGVTNRLVGGPANAFALEEHQSGGMGEGWSDYVACSVNNTIIVGDWVANNPGGIRGFPYTSDFPDNFGDLGTGRYSGFTPEGDRWPHPIGEIWCATLLEMNRNIGTDLGAQLVVDALKLTPANPSFLDARDAILEALNDMLAAGQLTADEEAVKRDGIWQAFARFGMGPAAQSNGPFLTGIVADFNIPEPEQPEQEPDIQVEATPDLAIPDNQAAGVSSVLAVAQEGSITRLLVKIDIEHTYIGDLRVSLTSPTGSTAILHNRNGGSADNLVETYTSEDVTALKELLGEEAQGDWRLHVADLAGIDVGTLNHWRLEMNLAAAGESAEGEAAPAAAIPDNDPDGISSAINIAQSGTAQRVQVSIDITHTFIGDLRVELVAPSGAQALLHDQFGGSADNLIVTFDSNTHPALADLVGQPTQGDWVLHVADLIGQDTGKLNMWRLELTH